MQQRDRWLLGAVLLAALVAMSLPLSAQQVNPLPPGDGRDLVAVTCTQCHGLKTFMQLREGRTAWRHEVEDMIAQGAQVSPTEFDVIVDYLATHFGPGVPFPNASPAHVDLAPGAGRDVVQTRCSICHGVDRVVSAKRTRAQWSSVVTNMISLGAPLDSAQAKTVLDYLNANYGL